MFRADKTDKVTSIEKLEQIDKKRLLDDKNVLLRQLSVNYRNSWEIQSFYNVFLAHYNHLQTHFTWDILTGIIEQPKMHPGPYSGAEVMETSILSGPKPIFFITNEEPDASSGDEVKKFLKYLEKYPKLMEIIKDQNNTLSAICFRDIDQRECRFCRSILSQFQTHDIYHPKLFHEGIPSNSSGFRGCEQDNIILHFDALYAHYPIFECFARARKILIVILSKTVLEGDHPFQKAIKETMKHEETCKNEVCKEKRWDKLKVVNVEYKEEKENDDIQEDIEGPCCCCIS